MYNELTDVNVRDLSRKVTIIIAFFSCIIFGTETSALDCPEPPEQSVVDNTFGVGASFEFVLKKIGLDFNWDENTLNLFEKYPNANELITTQFIFSMFCQLIEETDLSDDEKWNHFYHMMFEVRNFISSHSFTEQPNKLVFEGAYQFTIDEADTTNFDIRVNNPSDDEISINQFSLDFENEQGCGGFDSIREVSAQYTLEVESVGKDALSGDAQIGLLDDNQWYPAEAWYPSISSNCFSVRGNLQQLVKSKQSDRFQILAKLGEFLLQTHNIVVVQLKYEIGELTKQVDYGVRLKQ